MKSFFFILSCFMLWMSCLPCEDGHERISQEEAKISGDHNNKEHHHESEACSPFCVCSCCSTSAFFFTLNKIHTQKITFQSVKYPLYDVAINTKVYYAIWQPPKLS